MLFILVHDPFVIDIWGMSASNKHIEWLQKDVEKKVGWGPCTSWHSKMFDELSEEIFQRTHVSLSVATLKRFFGVVTYDGLPSVTTLDTLAKFLGEENWTTYKANRQRKLNWRIKGPGKTTYVAIGFVLAIVTISLLSNRRPELVINSSEFEFTSTVLSKDFPNTVVFDFSIPEDLRADSFKIQQYWDPTKTVTIDRTQTQATAIYYHPGYFEAKLLVDGQTVKRHDLFLKSNGWLGQIEYASTPKYFDPVIGENSLRFPEEIYEEVSKLEERTVTSFHFIDDLGTISGDNFTLHATLRNTFDDRWAVCHAIRIYVLATTGAFVIPFSKIGCSAEDNLLLNDVYLKGTSNDLSALSADFTDDTSIEVAVVNQQVRITINDEFAYENTYHESMGQVVGLRFKFVGLGEVVSFELFDQNGTQVI